MTNPGFKSARVTVDPGKIVRPFGINTSYLVSGMSVPNTFSISIDGASFFPAFLNLNISAAVDFPLWLKNTSISVQFIDFVYGTDTLKVSNETARGNVQISSYSGSALSEVPVLVAGKASDNPDTFGNIYKTLRLDYAGALRPPQYTPNLNASVFNNAINCPVNSTTYICDIPYFTTTTAVYNIGLKFRLHYIILNAGGGNGAFFIREKITNILGSPVFYCSAALPLGSRVELNETDFISYSLPSVNGYELVFFADPGLSIQCLYYRVLTQG